MTSLKSNDQLVELTYRFCLKRKGKLLALFGSRSKSLYGQDIPVLVSRLDENSSKITCLLIFQFLPRPRTNDGFFSSPFHATDLFLYPKKTSENQRF